MHVRQWVLFPDKNRWWGIIPCCFGGRRDQKNEKYLHSHLGEAFYGDYAMNKFHHMCHCHRYVWVTDCYAVKFILSYDGANQATLHLQMQLTGWDVDIVHCCNKHLVDANYWSCLDCNFCYDPLFHIYLRLIDDLCWDHPAPTEIPMSVEHMPYNWSPCLPNLQHSLDSHDDIIATTNAQDQAPAMDVNYAGGSLLTNIVTSGNKGFTSLSNRPSNLAHLAQSTRPTSGQF
jgi:hypothetical protein